MNSYLTLLLLFSFGLLCRACIPLGGFGCEANNGNCCRAGDPYTGTMRKCVNVGGFSSPSYKCVEAKRDMYENFNFRKRGSCIPLGGFGCEANNGKCCREGNPYTGTMRKCVNVGGFSSPSYKCVEAKRDMYENFNFRKRGSCVPLGGFGCEANNGKCCREGNPYTGTMRKCVNVGGFSSPSYKCVEAKRDMYEKFNLKRGSCIPLGGFGCEANDGKCCRDSGTIRKCLSVGTLANPKYQCVTSSAKDTLMRKREVNDELTKVQ